MREDALEREVAVGVGRTERLGPEDLRHAADADALQQRVFAKEEGAIQIGNLRAAWRIQEVGRPALGGRLGREFFWASTRLKISAQSVPEYREGAGRASIAAFVRGALDNSGVRVQVWPWRAGQLVYGAR